MAADFPPSFYDLRLDNHLAAIDEPFGPEEWAAVASSVQSLSETERSYVPHHKKGGTIAYETLERWAPELTGIYRSRRMLGLISSLAGIAVEPTPDHDQSSCSILIYDRPGDHIGWHYDHNFYRGRHFTVLVPVVNRGAKPGTLSSARLLVRKDGSEKLIPTPPNRLIVFEGAKVRHKVTPVAQGERRVIWSMTYCSDPKNAAWQGAARRIKDTAFFGIRALWT